MVRHRPIVCVGINHRSAPVGTRESALRALSDWMTARPSEHEAASGGDLDGIHEWAVVSTCNRLEIYAVLDPDRAEGQETALRGLLSGIGLDDAEAAPATAYAHRGYDVTDHLCRVACGLDSQVIGESEILGQVRSAYEAAIARRTMGPYLRALFGTAIRAGKRARTETAIGRNAASVSSVAVSLAAGAAGDLARRRIVIIGLGGMGRLVLRSLLGRGARNITLVNRSPDVAEHLAKEEGLAWRPWRDLGRALAEAEVVFTVTAAPEAVVDDAMVARAFPDRAQDPAVLVDLAVPRDIAPEAATVRGVRLFDIDDLNAELDRGVAARLRELPRVETIIAEELSTFHGVHQGLAARPVLLDLRKKAEAIREHELRRLSRYLGEKVDPETREHIERFSRTLVNRLLHEPTTVLRSRAHQGAADDHLATVRELFGLDGSGEGD